MSNFKPNDRFSSLKEDNNTFKSSKNKNKRNRSRSNRKNYKKQEASYDVRENKPVQNTDFQSNTIFPVLDNEPIKETIKGIIFEYVIFDDLAVKELKSNAEKLIKNNKSDIVCLISKIDSKASLVIAVDNKIAKKISAVEMVKEVSTILGGKGGGGRVDMAQSGGSLPENSPLAIESLKKYIDNKF